MRKKRRRTSYPKDQAWFWTPEWQAGEREADEDIRAGRTTRYENADAFLASFTQTKRQPRKR